MFVCAGENIYPGVVERLLERHADISEVAIVLLADETRGQVPVAFVVPRPQADLTEQAEKEFVLARASLFLTRRHHL